MVPTERTRLLSVIEMVRRTIARRAQQPTALTETISAIIDPILQAIGWNIFDPDEVAREQSSQYGDRVDIFANVDGRTVMFVEAKALRESFDDPKWISQTMRYGTNAGVDWCVLTNGREWRLYHANVSGADQARKLFRRFRIDAPEDQDVAISSIELMSRSRMAERAIDIA